MNNLGRASGKVKTFSKSLRQGIRKLLNWWKVQTLRKVLLLFNTYASKEFWYFFAKSTGLTNSNWEKLDWVDRFVWEALLFNTYAGKKCLYLWAENTGWSYSLLGETLTCWSWLQTHVVASKGAVLFQLRKELFFYWVLRFFFNYFLLWLLLIQQNKIMKFSRANKLKVS